MVMPSTTSISISGVPKARMIGRAMTIAPVSTRAPKMPPISEEK